MYSLVPKNVIRAIILALTKFVLPKVSCKFIYHNWIAFSLTNWENILKRVRRLLQVDSKCELIIWDYDPRIHSHLKQILKSMNICQLIQISEVRLLKFNCHQVWNLWDFWISNSVSVLRVCGIWKRLTFELSMKYLPFFLEKPLNSKRLKKKARSDKESHFSKTLPSLSILWSQETSSYL